MKIWQFIQENFLEIVSSVGAFFALFRTRKKLTPEQKKENKKAKIRARAAKFVAKAERRIDELEQLQEQNEVK